ncbi:O-antigen ligase family protein [Rhodococcoides fascians]|uniref:O-antigen ligase family protein n=1 Tax=Rhodococcoides fascians TaxID=1828 RepID=UPI00389A4ED8
MLIVVLALASLLTMVLVVKCLRSGHLVWDIGSWFILILGWAKLVSIVYGKLSGQVVVSRDTRGELLISPVSLSPQIETLIMFGLLAFAMFMLVHSSYRNQPRAISYFGIAVMATSVVAMLADPTAYRNVFTGNPMILLVVLFAATVAIPSRRGILTGGAVFVLSVCSLGAFIGVFDSSKVFMACRTDKCAVTGDFYMAATSHGNTLGLITAVGIPFIWLAFTGRTRLWMLAYVGANLVLTGSRTAMFAGAAVALVLFLTRPTRDAGDHVVGKNRQLLTYAVVLASVVAAVLPFTQRPDLFATGRGYLWRIAFEQVERTPILGAGLTAWDKLFEQGEIGAAAAYSTHNQWMEILFLGGIVAFVIWILGYAALIACGSDSLKFTVLPVLLALAILGATERPMSIGLVNSMTWTLVALIALSTVDRRVDQDPSRSTQSPSTRSQRRYQTAT